MYVFASELYFLFVDTLCYEKTEPIAIIVAKLQWKNIGFSDGQTLWSLGFRN